MTECDPIKDDIEGWGGGRCEGWGGDISGSWIRGDGGIDGGSTF